MTLERNLKRSGGYPRSAAPDASESLEEKVMKWVKEGNAGLQAACSIVELCLELPAWPVFRDVLLAFLDAFAALRLA